VALCSLLAAQLRSVAVPRCAMAMALAAKKIRTGRRRNMKPSSKKPSFPSRLGRWTAIGCIGGLVLVSAMEIAAIGREAGARLWWGNGTLDCGFTRWVVWIYCQERSPDDPILEFKTFRVLPFPEPLVQLRYFNESKLSGIELPFWFLNGVLLPFPIGRWLWRWRRRKSAPVA
jgi:hypothetical protein